jgi:hypothetical protein
MPKNLFWGAYLVFVSCALYFNWHENDFDAIVAKFLA